MVMRKFKRSLDNTVEDSSDPNQLGVNSPGLARRNRGGSLSGELGGEVTNSPAGTRRRFVYKSYLSTQKMKFYVKLHMTWFVYILVNCLFTFFRRSRIPSEEDDKLFNFLQTGGLDPSRERNTSLGNLVAESQQNYGTYTHFHEKNCMQFF